MLQTELQIWQKEEFSGGVLDRLTSDRRPRTLMVYDAKWRVFTEYCRQHSLSPLDLSIPQLAEFFEHLFVREEALPQDDPGLPLLYRQSIQVTRKS